MVKQFLKTFLHVLWLTKTIYSLMLALILLGGWAISSAESMPLADSLYFAMITSLTIGYGDVVVVTPLGRSLAVILGFVGIIFTGMIVATAVFCLRHALGTVRPDLYGKE